MFYGLTKGESTKSDSLNEVRFLQNGLFIFGVRLPQRMDRPRGVFPRNVPHGRDGRKLESIFILRDLVWDPGYF